MCTNLLQGQQSEWALLKRHESEDVFGVQVTSSYINEILQNSLKQLNGCCCGFGQCLFFCEDQFLMKASVLISKLCP